MSASRPGSLMIPTFTGRSTVTRSPRSGMKAREGTPRKRLLSTIHAEYFGARSAICASLKLVRRKLVGPELRPDLSDLVAPFLTQRVRRAQVFLASVVEHLEDLERRSLEQTDRAEVVRVGRLE